MHYAPLARRHWVQGRGASAACDASRCPAGESSKHVCPALPVVFDIDHNVRLTAKLAAHDHADKELQRLQCLAAPADQQTGVLTLDLEHKRAVFGVVSYIGLCDDSHGGEEVVEDLGDKLLCLFVPLGRGAIFFPVPAATFPWLLFERVVCF